MGSSLEVLGQGLLGSPLWAACKAQARGMTALARCLEVGDEDTSLDSSWFRGCLQGFGLRARGFRCPTSTGLRCNPMLEMHVCRFKRSAPGCMPMVTIVLYKGSLIRLPIFRS